MMDDLHTLVQRSLQSKGLESKADASVILFKVQDWIKANYPALQDCITAEKIQDSELICIVTHSIAAQELQSSVHILQEFIMIECGVQIETIRIIRK